MLLLVCVVKKISKTVIARLIVRLEGKLSSLGRAHPIFCNALSPGRAPQKSGGAPAFCALHFQIASGATACGTKLASCQLLSAR